MEDKTLQEVKGQTQNCPKCKEPVQPGAKKCKHCGSDMRNWFARHKIITSIVALIILGNVIAALDKGEESATGTNSSTEQQAQKSWYEVKTFSGKGNQDTSSFHISGDHVKITATTCCATTSSGTYSAVDLESDSGGYLGAGLSISTRGTEQGYGETTYRNLKPGDYYISVITGVGWEVKVEEYR